MFKHSRDGPKLLRSHVFFENQYIWNGVTTGLSKLCMACLNNGDSSLCRYGTSCFYGILELQMVPPPAHLLFVMLESSGSFATRLEDQMLRPCAGFS